MTKAGLAYEKLVALIEAAFDSGADVKVGEWIDGPDGRRELDVSVRGVRNGEPYFAIAECKDYRGNKGKKKVDVAVIDGLDSKSRDLKADLVAVYANCDFTSQALQKAKRLGITTFTAVATGDERSRAKAWTMAVGRMVEVSDLTEQIIEPDGHDMDIPTDLGIEEITFEGAPVHNWVADLIAEVLSNEAHANRTIVKITAIVHFEQPLVFLFRGEPGQVAGLQIIAGVATKWMGKPLPVSVDLGKFDLQTGRLMIPGGTSFIVGLPADEEGWEPIDEPTKDELPSGSLNFTIMAKLQARLVKARGAVPDLDAHVQSTDVILT